MHLITLQLLKSDLPAQEAPFQAYDHVTEYLLLLKRPLLLVLGDFLTLVRTSGVMTAGLYPYRPSRTGGGLGIVLEWCEAPEDVDLWITLPACPLYVLCPIYGGSVVRPQRIWICTLPVAKIIFLQEIIIYSVGVV